MLDALNFSLSGLKVSTAVRNPSCGRNFQPTIHKILPDRFRPGGLTLRSARLKNASACGSVCRGSPGNGDPPSRCRVDDVASRPSSGPSVRCSANSPARKSSASARATPVFLQRLLAEKHNSTVREQVLKLVQATVGKNRTECSIIRDEWLANVPDSREENQYGSESTQRPNGIVLPTAAKILNWTTQAARSNDSAKRNKRHKKGKRRSNRNRPTKTRVELSPLEQAGSTRENNCAPCNHKEAIAQNSSSQTNCQPEEVHVIKPNNCIVLSKSHSDTVLTTSHRGFMNELNNMPPAMSVSGSELRDEPGALRSGALRENSLLSRLSAPMHASVHLRGVAERPPRQLSPLLSSALSTICVTAAATCSTRVHGRAPRATLVPPDTAAASERELTIGGQAPKLSLNNIPFRQHRPSARVKRPAPGRNARKSTKVYLSDAQTHTHKELGRQFPGAPPSTPIFGSVPAKFEYVPSMSDVRSQRNVKCRLEALQKFRRERTERLREQTRQNEKLAHGEKVAALKRQQRLQIYALNKIMTENEHTLFIKFCDANNIAQ